MGELGPRQTNWASRGAWKEGLRGPERPRQRSEGVAMIALIAGEGSPVYPVVLKFVAYIRRLTFVKPSPTSPGDIPQYLLSLWNLFNARKIKPLL